MPTLRILSAVEQVSAYLRKEMANGSLSGAMPGVKHLAKDLGVSPKTVVGALKQLESEGLISGQGARRKRLITPGDHFEPRQMRVVILPYENPDRRIPYIVDLQHELIEAGHAVSFASKSLTDMSMEVAAVERLVNRTEADAWIVIAGSHQVLEWFCEQPTPAFALFGRRSQLPIAATGPATIEAVSTAIHDLLALGHRRIVKICRGERRKPNPGETELAFLKELSAQDIPTGDYNLPDWDESVIGFQKLMNSLFEFTPPTAILFDEAPFLVAAQQFLGARGLRVPEDVSLVCCVPDPAFAWCTPSIAHVNWDSQTAVRRIVRWAASVGRGSNDERQTQVSAEFVRGDTIGPAPTS